MDPPSRKGTSPPGGTGGYRSWKMFFVLDALRSAIRAAAAERVLLAFCEKEAYGPVLTALCVESATSDG